MLDTSHTPQSSQREFGQYLKGQRERKHLSIATVSKTIRVSEANLVALESGSFSQLPRVPFLLGVIKSYGTAIGCDSDELQQKMQQLFPTSRPSAQLHRLGQPSDPTLVGFEKSSFYLTRRLVVFTGALIVLGIGIWVGLDFFSPQLSEYVRSLRQSGEVGAKVPEQKPSSAAGVLPAYELGLSSVSPNVVKVVTLDEARHEERTERIVLQAGDSVTVRVQGSNGKLWALKPEDLKVFVNRTPHTVVWDQNQVTELKLAKP